MRMKRVVVEEWRMENEMEDYLALLYYFLRHQFSEPLIRTNYIFGVTNRARNRSRPPSTMFINSLKRF